MDRRALIGVLSAQLLLIVAIAAPAQSPLGHDVAILDPGGHALSAFHASLGRGGRTRVMVWPHI